MEAVISVEVDRYGEEARQRWTDWLTIADSRCEWKAAVKRAKMEPEWVGWVEAQRRDYVDDLLSPFILSPDLITKFVDAANVKD